MNDTQKSMLCGNCGKQAVFTVRAEWKKDEVAIIDSPYNEGQDIITWRVLECTGCKSPTLAETKSLYSFVDHELYAGVELISSETIILYPGAKPAKTPLTNLPETIEKKYQAALKVQDIEPSACAVLVGRTLEAVCNYEKATGKTLSDKVNNLVNSDRIPTTLAEMAHQLRQIRNFGAHDADDEVTEEDVPIILDFLEAILEYLYVAPAKIAAVQARLKKTP
jgi:Domain of unknown function (DUF4145)